MNQHFDLRQQQSSATSTSTSQQQHSQMSNNNNNSNHSQQQQHPRPHPHSQQREAVSLPWQTTDSTGLPSLVTRDSRSVLSSTPYTYGMFLGTDGSRSQHMLSPMESCIVKSGIAGILGGGMVLLF